MNVRRHNRDAWNRLVEKGDRWTVPVDADTIARARGGDWEVVLTPRRPVPRAWFGDLRDRDLLGLASGGGQQGPIFAAAGATVTILDASTAQLARDREVAARDGLSLATVEGDMATLPFRDASFDIVFHPCANSFVPNVRPVWREAFRVLRPGGALLAGFVNPLVFLFDEDAYDRNELVVRHSIPFSDLTAHEGSDPPARLAEGNPLEFGHTLQDQIGGQLDAGFVLTEMFEDRWDGDTDPLSRFIALFIATRAVKPA